MDDAALESDSTLDGLGWQSNAHVFILSTHLSAGEVTSMKQKLKHVGTHVVEDAQKANLFVAKIRQRRRAAMELRTLGILTEDIATVSVAGISDRNTNMESPSKRAKLSTYEESKAGSNSYSLQPSSAKNSSQVSSVYNPGSSDESESNVIYVVAANWVEDSFRASKLCPLERYMVYRARKVAVLTEIDTDQALQVQPLRIPVLGRLDGTHDSTPIERLDASSGPQRPTTIHFGEQKYKRASGKKERQSAPKLVRESTSERDENLKVELPDPPDWVKRGSVYSCERSTPENGPNESFVAQLKKIRSLRQLHADDIGVRAYSTSIASIAAYPHKLISPKEILQLPGCDQKIASLWSEWKSQDGFIEEASKYDSDPEVQVLKLFFDIWDVGEKAARRFYNMGWRDLDDIVEFGWADLSRLQQVGVKYYDEFLQTMPRSEVEFIAAKVHEHAKRVREPNGVRSCIVGGYRRGKQDSHDVDVVLTHTDEDETVDLVNDVVDSLVKDGYVVHELITYTSASRRNQSTLPYRTGGGGHGFDTLDKAFVVWQDPVWDGMEQFLDLDTKARRKKNPNVHRRVDIIVAPWSRIGCAVLGWSAGTTFERDLRRFAKYKKGWKFDSSGVRDRMSGKEIDLESSGGRSTSIEEAERKVFAGFGLTYREPWERCTG